MHQMLASTERRTGRDVPHPRAMSSPSKQHQMERERREREARVLEDLFQAVPVRDRLKLPPLVARDLLGRADAQIEGDAASGCDVGRSCGGLR